MEKCPRGFKEAEGQPGTKERKAEDCFQEAGRVGSSEGNEKGVVVGACYLVATMKRRRLRDEQQEG